MTPKFSKLIGCNLLDAKAIMASSGVGRHILQRTRVTGTTLL
jgi:hypothetical protein